MQISTTYNHNGREIEVTAFFVKGQEQTFNQPGIKDEIIEVEADSIEDQEIIDSNMQEVESLLWKNIKYEGEM